MSFFLCCLFSPLVLRVPELAEIPQSTAQAKADEIARRLAEAGGTGYWQARRICAERRGIWRKSGFFPAKIQITIHAVDKSRIEISELILVLQESDREREGRLSSGSRICWARPRTFNTERNEANEPEGDEGTPEPFVQGIKD